MSAWPREIASDEAIVRGIYNFYVKRGKLQTAAYRAPRGTDEVSVMRHAWIGSEGCKQHARDLEHLPSKKRYMGLAVLSATQIVGSGADLVDTREEFDGHADIRHGIITPIDGDPLPPDQLMIINERIKTLLALATYYEDPVPSAPTWNGPDLHYRIG
jgi:hypothetical protein